MLSCDEPVFAALGGGACVDTEPTDGDRFRFEESAVVVVVADSMMVTAVVMA